MKVKFSYLEKQFSNCNGLWAGLKNIVSNGDFTLGKELENFEKNFSKLIGSKYALGVASGTDAIKLSLRILNIGRGDEVITAANTFIATAGAIIEVGAKPVFVDCDDTFCMDVNLVEKKNRHKTNAILQGHYTGYIANMPKLIKLSKKYKIPIVEDSCQGILAEINKKKAGTWGDFGAFSLHPLKTINVWGDGGIITTNNYSHYKKLKMIRNHGLINRDEANVTGHNSRLHNLQAAVGNYILPKARSITKRKIQIAKYYDKALSKIPKITIPPRIKNHKIVYHLYIIFAEERDKLIKHCLKKGIEAKIHYPKPLYLQKALKGLKHKRGDFPVTDSHVKKIISLPCNQYMKNQQINYVANTIKDFYKKNS